MLALSLSASAYEEVKTKLTALGLKEARIKVVDGLEILDMNDLVLTRDKNDGDDVSVYIAYQGKVLKAPKGELNE